jgi:hypothetical protein
MSWHGPLATVLVLKHVLWAACVVPLLLLWSALARPAGASSNTSAHAKTELVAEKDFIEPGQNSWLGFHFELESGWHIYWINPGDSGEPPRVQWRPPTGFRTGSIQWPAPQRIEDHSLVDYGYEGEVLLMVPLQAPAHLPQGILIYDGAIDDKPTTDLEDVARGKNYVSAALQEAMAGKEVAVATSRPYGCSVTTLAEA